jgi:dedicator of cytokinesis protein 6/7/8
MLGSYYRVGFYGVDFEELNGKEFIYKEPKITKLSEIKDRLKVCQGQCQCPCQIPDIIENSLLLMQALYEKRFGAGKVEILTTSKTPDPAELDAAMNYVQITSVEPYFDETEQAERTTPFMKANNLCMFYSTHTHTHTHTHTLSLSLSLSLSRRGRRELEDM